MAVQLLEDWLLKEQEKVITTYRELNQAPLKEPGLIFVGVLPVSQEERYKQKVYVRTNEKIQALNQTYQELAQAYRQVSYVDVYSSLLDEVGQLAEAYTTDGLHLSVAGYRILAQALQEIV